jgi:predicted nucleic acid-binding protein
MRERVILDTGPLVAFLNRRDQYHSWVKMQWAQITPPLLTCEAVLAEACFLVQHLQGGSSAVVDLVQRGVLALSFHLSRGNRCHFQNAEKVRKYSNLPRRRLYRPYG